MEILEKALTAFEPQVEQVLMFLCYFEPTRDSLKLLKWSRFLFFKKKSINHYHTQKIVNK